MFSFTLSETWSTSSYEGFWFLKTHPKNKTTLTTTGRVFSCREYYIREWRRLIGSCEHNAPSVKKAYTLVTLGRPYVEKKSNFQENLDRYMIRSMYILNSFEKHHKWPLTKVYPVKLVGLRTIPFVFIAGHRKWTMSPYLMSLWTLAIRLGRCEWLPKKLTTMNHEKMVRSIIRASSGEPGGDASQAKMTIGQWDTVMSLYSKLFAGQTRKWHWSGQRLTKGHSAVCEGIQRFINGTTYNRDLYNKYVNLKKRGVKS